MNSSVLGSSAHNCLDASTVPGNHSQESKQACSFTFTRRITYVPYSYFTAKFFAHSTDERRLTGNQ